MTWIRLLFHFSLKTRYAIVKHFRISLSLWAPQFQYSQGEIWGREFQRYRIMWFTSCFRNYSHGHISLFYSIPHVDFSLFRLRMTFDAAAVLYHFAWLFLSCLFLRDLSILLIFADYAHIFSPRPRLFSYASPRYHLFITIFFRHRIIRLRADFWYPQYFSFHFYLSIWCSRLSI